MRDGSPRWLALATLLVAGCDIPTSTRTPIIQSQFLVPVKADSVGVAELLPSGVTLVGGQFRVSVPATTASQTLGGLCGGLCSGFLPKPQFNGTVTASVSQPASVASAVTGTGGTLTLTFTNGLGFDPVRPPGTPSRGRIVTTVTSGTGVVLVDTLDGTNTAVPGGVSTYTIAIPAGRTLGPVANASMAVFSPATSTAVNMQPTSAFGVTVTPTAVSAASATVRVVNEAFSSTSASLSFDDLSADVRDRVDSATAEVAVANPLAVSGGASLTFRQGAAAIVGPKNVTLSGAAADTLRVRFSSTEIRSLLASTGATAVFAGTVSGPAGNGNQVTVTPASQVRLDTRVRLFVRIDGN
ncbi:MAG: hypothetical protein NW201_07660 [Gemmatimonadales bacterium]|nr:hypothetical protein [Gemmatimonadales bacterium]